MSLRLVVVLLSWIVTTPGTSALELDARPVEVATSPMIQVPAHSNPDSPSRRELTSESVIEDEESDDLDLLISPSLPSSLAVLLTDPPIGRPPVPGQSFASRTRRPANLRC